MGIIDPKLVFGELDETEDEIEGTPQKLEGLPALRNLTAGEKSPEGRNILSWNALTDAGDAPLQEVILASVKSIPSVWKSSVAGFWEAQNEFAQFIAPDTPVPVQAFLESTFTPEAQERARTWAKEGRTRLEELRPEDMNFLGEVLYTTGISLGIFVPVGVLAALTTRSVPAAMVLLGSTFGATTFGDTYSTLRDTGYDPGTSTAVSSIMGLSEGLLGTYGAHVMLKQMSGLNFRFVKQLAAEMGGEQANLVVQSATAWMTFAPEMTWKDYFDNMKLTTGTVVLSSAGMAGVGHLGQGIKGRFDERKPSKLPEWLMDQGIDEPLSDQWQEPKYILRFGETSERENYYINAGSFSPYADAGAPDTKGYDASELNLADLRDSATRQRLIDARKEEGNLSYEEEALLDQMAFEASETDGVPYQLNPGTLLGDTAKRLGFDGIENIQEWGDTPGSVSSLIVWNHKKLRPWNKQAQSAAAHKDGRARIDVQQDAEGNTLYVPVVRLGRGFLETEVALEPRSTPFEASRIAEHVMRDKDLERRYINIMAETLDGVQTSEEVRRAYTEATGKEVDRLFERVEDGQVQEPGLIAGPFTPVNRAPESLIELAKFVGELENTVQKLGGEESDTALLNKKETRKHFGLSEEPVPAVETLEDAHTKQFDEISDGVFVLKPSWGTDASITRKLVDISSSRTLQQTPAWEVTYRSGNNIHTLYAPTWSKAANFLIEGPYYDLGRHLLGQALNTTTGEMATDAQEKVQKLAQDMFHMEEYHGGGFLQNWFDTGVPERQNTREAPPGSVVLSTISEGVAQMWNTPTGRELYTRMKKQLEWLLKRYYPEGKIELELRSDHSTIAAQTAALESGTIRINLRRNPYTLEDTKSLTSTLTHEFWHGLIMQRFLDQPLPMRRAVVRKYREWVARMLNTTLKNFTRDMALDISGIPEHLRDKKVSDMIAQGADILGMPMGYYLGFHEFAVRQMERLIIKDPLAMKELKDIWGSTAEDLVDFFTRISTRNRPQDKVMQAWFSHRPATAAFKDALASYVQEQKRKRLKEPVFSFDNTAEAYREILVIDKMSKELGLPPEVVKALKESGDKGIDIYNNFMRYGATLFQLANENLGNLPLQQYANVTRDFNTTAQKWFRRFNEVIHMWEKLGKTQGNLLGKFFQEWTLMETRPSNADVAKMMEKYGLEEEALRAFHEIDATLRSMLDEMKDAVWAEAQERFDGNQAALAIEQAKINAEFAALKTKPYFPLMRFGKYTIMLRAKHKLEYGGKNFAKNAVVAFETFETETDQKARLKELQGKYHKNHPDIELSASLIIDEFQQYLGLPPSLVRAMANKVGLTKKQQLQLDDLVKELSPAHKFIHHFTSRKEISGFSTDAMRGLGLYGWQGARHVARVLHHRDFQRALRDMKRYVIEASKSPEGGVKAARIYDHLQRHYDYIMDPPTEWAALRAVGFVWFLGFSVKGAMVNLTQPFLVTYPWLAERYGDAAAIAELNQAFKDMFSYYQKAGKVIEKLGKKKRADTLTAQEKEILEIAEGIEAATDSGLLNQSYATELAAVKEGASLQVAQISKKSGRWVKRGAYYAAWMFQHTEGLIRHAAWIAAYRLARKEGYSVETSYLAARHAVESTIYEFSSFNRPGYMRGKKSVFFLFWQFMHNTAYLAGGRQGAGTAIRMWLMFLFLAGLQGLPGADDMLEFVSYAGTKLKGEHFDVKHELREALRYIADNPDYIMHGASRASFGLPWVGEMLGIEGIPEVDFSGSMSMGKIVPGVDAAFARSGDWRDRIARGQEDAVGAVGAIGYGMLRMMFEKNPDTWKRIEYGLPTTVRGISRAVRRGVRGEETDTNGARVAEFDPWNPTHLGELVAQAMAAPTTRVMQKYEQTYAIKQVSQYWMARRVALMSTLDWAWRNGDREAMAETVRSMKEFNKEVPFPELGIRGQDLVNSLSQRALRRWKKERGLPVATRDIRAAREVQELFPVEGGE